MNKIIKTFLILISVVFIIGLVFVIFLSIKQPKALKSQIPESKNQTVSEKIQIAIQKIISSPPIVGYGPIPLGVRVLNVRVDGGNKITINLSKELLSKGVGNVLEDSLHQILTPLSNVVPEIKHIEYVILIENIPLQEYSTPSKSKEDGNQSTWLYFNKKANFELELPKEAKVERDSKIVLPVTPNTNLREKYLVIGVEKSSDRFGECLINPAGIVIDKDEVVKINNIEFKKGKSTEGGMGHAYDSVIYSTIKEDKCIVLIFTLGSIDPRVFDPENRPKLFDQKSESKIFEQIISSFKFREEI